MATGANISPIGVLRLEGKPANGTNENPYAPIASSRFGFNAIERTVPGAWAERVVPGDPSLEDAYVTTAKRLVADGAIVITSNCGFTARYQSAVAAAVGVPVVMSSVLMLALLLRQLPAASKIAVLTYDSTHCNDEVLGLQDESDRSRVVVAGVEGGIFWRNERARPAIPTDAAVLESEVLASLAQARSAHPDIAAILLECAGFPAFAAGMRRATGLPVFDVTQLIQLAIDAAGE